MNVSLTPELERQIEQRVESGLYSSSSEVVREALRLFFRYDAARIEQMQRLNEKIAEGLDQLDRGRGLSEEEARAESRRRLDKRLATKYDPEA